MGVQRETEGVHGDASGHIQQSEATPWGPSVGAQKGKEGLTMDSGWSWSLVVQGTKQFLWKSSRATNEDIATLRKDFSRCLFFWWD